MNQALGIPVGPWSNWEKIKLQPHPCDVVKLRMCLGDRGPIHHWVTNGYNRVCPRCSGRKFGNMSSVRHRPGRKGGFNSES